MYFSLVLAGFSHASRFDGLVFLLIISRFDPPGRLTSVGGQDMMAPMESKAPSLGVAQDSKKKIGGV